MRALQTLGARSVPVVSRGSEFVFAQVISDVVAFLGLDDDTGPQLSPHQLAQRYHEVLNHAISLVTQMPNEHLERELPNRPRSWRVLLHHIFQIPNAFLDMEENGRPMAYEDMVAPPPDDLVSSEQIAAFGRGVQQRFDSWWHGASESNFDNVITVYFGETTRHEMLERTVWHSTQHVRQLASLLESVGIKPQMPLTPHQLQGLPLTEKVWDES